MSTMAERVVFAKDDVKVASLALRAAVDAKLPADASFEVCEAAWLAACNEATRAGLETELQRLSDECGQTLQVDGVRYGKHEMGTVEYHSLCGPLSIRRATYRRAGERNGPTVVPVELKAGLVERATPALAYDVMQGIAKEDMRSHHENLLTAHRVPPSRSTLERMSQHIGDAAHQHAWRIEAYVRRDEPLPVGAHAVSVGMDRVAVPMEEPRAQDAPPRTRKRKTPRVRKAPAPVDVNFRMAYIGTVSIVDERGEVLKTRKYAIPASGDPATQVAAKMADDVRTALRKKPGLSVGIVQDGAPEMWNLVRDALAKQPKIITIHEAIDRYHIMERLGKALALIESDDGVRKATLGQWSTDFDQRDSAIDSIEHWLIKRHSELHANKAAELWEHLVYIRRNKDRMRYVTLRIAGLPVGSGATEGGCKSVVGKRACGSGQRWHDRGLGNVLALRAIHQSSRLPRFWSHLARRYSPSVMN